MFETLERRPPDAILRLIGEHRNDPRTEKIDLGVGVYRNAAGDTPILKTVKKAEHWLVGSQQSKAYFGSRGDVEFCAVAQDLTFGVDSGKSGRIATIQTPGGSGALSVAAGVILRASPQTTIWVSDPTWSNHVPLLAGAGVKLEVYPYYDHEQHSVRFADMMTALDSAQSGDVLLLHGCCHNPTGMDLTAAEWEVLIDFIAERQLIPLVDLAYQGFAADLDTDAAPVRALFARVPEMIVATSCSKNFGLYRDRVGSLSIVTGDADTASIILSQALTIVRTIYSVPPDHGAAVVAKILNDDQLRAEWIGELSEMRGRLKNMRSLMVAELSKAATGHDFTHIGRANGMFCHLGVTPEQVARLKKDFAIYLADTSRINVCGVTKNNVSYLAESVAKVL